MSNTHTQRRAEAGFTLVELAIVLVIIGLIIGGVLVGQDMIKGAEVRATAGQFEKYSAAVNTFKDKYRQIPGDLTAATATQFGFVTGRGTTSDGNGLLTGCANDATKVSCETINFWVDLSSANLVDGSFATISAADGAPAVATTLPAGRMGRGNMITAYATGGFNFYQLTGVAAIAAGVPTLSPTLTPQEAFNIDSKLDDGKPLTGSTQARSGATAAALNTAAPAGTAGALTACVVTATTDYNTTTADAAGTPICTLRVRFN